MDANFKAALRDICTSPQSVALVTIIACKGSTPRKPGAKMLVTPDGQTYGTIGGGCGESEVRQRAIHALSIQTSTKYVVSMTNDLAAEEGMVCGGIMEVFIDVIKSGATDHKELFLTYLDALDSNHKPTLITITWSSDETRKLLGKKLLISDNGLYHGDLGNAILTEMSGKWVKLVNSQKAPSLISMDDVELFIEPAPTMVQLLILGGGHIALPLATMAKLVGYQVTVVDDRPSFANAIRFQCADQVICNDFTQAIRGMTITPETFVVIVTRGHRHDKLCLLEVIEQPAGYIGMIGSRRRVKALLTDLETEGISPDLISSIHSPIGLDIGAETPEEVAVSILAELIKVNRFPNIPKKAGE